MLLASKFFEAIPPWSLNVSRRLRRYLAVARRGAEHSDTPWTSS